MKRQPTRSKIQYLSQPGETGVVPQTDWDFSACPDDQLTLCLYYEYTRQLALEYRKVVGASFTVSHLLSCFFKFYSDKKSDHMEDLSQSPAPGLKRATIMNKTARALIVCSLPGFPDCSFLEGPAKIADTKRLAITMNRNNQGFDIIRDPALVQSYYRSHLKKFFQQAGLKNEKHKVRNKLVLVDYGVSIIEKGLVLIDWTQSNKNLVKSFASWVATSRPPDIKANELRGTTTIREKLKYLSAYRLIEVMSPNKANALTERCLGESFYDLDRDWYRARKKFQKTMQQFFEPFFRFGKNGNIEARPPSSLVGDIGARMLLVSKACPGCGRPISL